MTEKIMQGSNESRRESEDRRSNQSNHPRWWLYTILLTFFLAIVLTIVQQILLGGVELNRPVRDFSTRFLWNYLSFTVAAVLFPRRLLTGWILLVAMFQTGVLFFYFHFTSIPSYTSLFGNVQEGIEVFDAIVDLFPWRMTFLFLVLAGIQIFLQKVRDQYSLPWKHKAFILLGTFAAWTVLLLGTNHGQRALTSSFPYPLEQRVAKFGLMPVLIHEAVFQWNHPKDKLLETVYAQESLQSDLLQGVYAPDRPPGNLVVIQVESLDYSLMRFKVGDKEVTPFLNDLASQSLEYRIRSILGYGSATSDFVMLNGVPPMQGVFNYNIPDCPFRTSLPLFLENNGYRTFVVHGVRGTFYNRRDAFGKMRFEHYDFREEIVRWLEEEPESLARKYPAETIEAWREDEWLRDKVVFEYSTWLLERNRDSNNFLFIITSETHGPYKHPHNRELIPQERTSEDRYLNSFYDLDRNLQEFYETLPDGTLVMIYGDHAAYLTSHRFTPDIEQGVHHVPLIISVKGRDLSSMRDSAIPQGDPLTLRDAYSYIKRVSEPKAERDETGTSASFGCHGAEKAPRPPWSAENSDSL